MGAIAYSPNDSIFPDVFTFPFPKVVAEKFKMDGFSMSIRSFFEHFAAFHADRDPKYAALLREAASYFPDVDGSYVLSRDKHGNVLYDNDDWDELSDDERINRGNRYAAIAVLDRLRFELEIMSDGPDHKDDVTQIRRSLAELAFAC